MSIGPPLRRQCKLPGCEEIFALSEDAPHKLFCCREHKTEWHTRQARLARQLLRQQEGKPGGLEEN